MKKKIFNILNHVYGILMSLSFFGGVLPLVPFIIALCIGGTWGEKISVFLYEQYYPWVIIIGSAALVIGVIAMYIGKIEALSIKNISSEENKEKPKDENTK